MKLFFIHSVATEVAFLQCNETDKWICVVDGYKTIAIKGQNPFDFSNAAHIEHLRKIKNELECVNVPESYKGIEVLISFL